MSADSDDNKFSVGAVVSAKDQADAVARFNACTRAGYQEIQLNLSNETRNSEALKPIQEFAAKENLAITAFGGYANPLQPDSNAFGLTSEELYEFIEAAAVLPSPLGGEGPGVRGNADELLRIITYSGTLSGQLATIHPGNQNPGAFEELLAWTKSLLPALEKMRAQMLFKPHQAHVLFSVDMVEEFLENFDTPHIGIALDPCALLLPKTFHEREAIILDSAKRLGDRTALIHLRDARIENFKIALCGPGQGQMGFAGMLKIFARWCPDAKLLIDGVESELSLKRAREYVELQARLAGV